jgi:DNA adenine methylase
MQQTPVAAVHMNSTLLRMATKPVLRWPGGKRRLVKQILPLFRPHTCYVEAFGGGLAVLLAKDRSPIEIVNDINRDLVSLYRCAQFHLDALCAEIEWTLNSRANMADFISQPGITELQRAARFLCRNKVGFGSSMTSYAVQKASGGGATVSRAGTLELLRGVSARLDKVSIECVAYERLFKLYDAPATLWFLDPPYVNGEVEAYEGFTEAQMTEFADRVHALQGDWVVTVDDCPLNRALFGKDEFTAVETSSGAVNRRLKPAAKFGELIIRRRVKGAVAISFPLKELKRAA